MTQAALNFDAPPEPLAPAGSRYIGTDARAALLDSLAGRCVKNQPEEWWQLCVEVAVALMTHQRDLPGSYLTAAVRLVAAHRGRTDLEPSTHNAWVSAIRMLLGSLGEYGGRVEAVTVQTHDRHVGIWRSRIYDPRAPLPDWWPAVMTLLERAP